MCQTDVGCLFECLNFFIQRVCSFLFMHIPCLYDVSQKVLFLPFVHLMFIRVSKGPLNLHDSGYLHPTHHRKLHNANSNRSLSADPSFFPLRSKRAWQTQRRPNQLPPHDLAMIVYMSLMPKRGKMISGGKRRRISQL